MMINLSAGDQNMRWAGTILYVLIWTALVSCRAAPAGEASSTGGPSQRPDTASDAPLGPNARKMLELATQHLASRLDVNPEEISAISIRQVEWRDGALGCPKPAVDYIQQRTPGYRIWLGARGEMHEYHTDSTSRVVTCDQR
jgi:hypothetical protein